MIQAFQQAVETGELQRLLDILAPDVVALSDGGGVKRALLRPVAGAYQVARCLAARWDRHGVERAIELVQVNGGPGLLVRVNDEIHTVMAVRIDDGLITGLYAVRNPEKLSHVKQETTVSR